MKKYLVLITLSLTIFSCTSTKKQTNKITGKVESYDANSAIKSFYLYEATETGFPSIDTALVQENGEFYFNIPTNKQGLYGVGVSDKNALTIYLDSNTKEQTITIKDLTRLSKGYEVKGHEVSIKIAEFTAEVNKMMALGSRLNKESQALSFNDTVALKKLYDEFQEKSELFVETRNAFIDKNMTSPALIVVLDQIDPKQEFDLLKEVIKDGLGNSIPDTYHYKGLLAYLSQIEAEKIKKERLENFLKPGSPAPELTFPGVNGENVSLSSLKGKVVLLDFWASWCRPCRAENPNVVRLYNKYKSKGFDIYSFSLDQEKEKWLKAIEQDGLVWKSHASDLKGWETAARPVYGFEAIPFTVLIDKQGNIIAKNLRGAELEAKLAELLN
jgi:thiol-disulfide isomerase/thioredoxin